MQILLVEDDRDLRRFLAKAFKEEGYGVTETDSGDRAVERALAGTYSCLVLDVMLPGRDGFSVVAELRRRSVTTPVLLLTARDELESRVRGLEGGADDYLTKPFSMGELIARIRVALRHAAPPRTEPVFQTGELAIDFERRRVTMRGAEVHLTPTEYEVLKYLAQNVGKVVTHRMLLHAVWGPDYETEAHYLRVFMNQLRRKIEPDPSRPHYLLTEPGIGYRLRSPD